MFIHSQSCLLFAHNRGLNRLYSKYIYNKQITLDANIFLHYYICNMSSDLTKDEIAVRIAKGALGAIPLVGGLIGELFDLAVNTKYEKRQVEWYSYVNETLQKLIENGVFTKEQLFEDENFQTIISKTSRVYLDTVEKNKMPLVKAYLQSALSKDIQLDKKYIFLSILSQLTETQLLLLREIHESSNNGNHLFFFRESCIDYLTGKFAGGDQDFYYLLQKGLEDFHLLWHHKTKPNGKPKEGNEAVLTTSKIGSEFIDFLLK